MLYPVYIGIENDDIQTVHLLSNQDDYTSILIEANKEYETFDLSCFGSLTLAEQAQLKALIDYLI